MTFVRGQLLLLVASKKISFRNKKGNLRIQLSFATAVSSSVIFNTSERYLKIRGKALEQMGMGYF